MHIVISKAPKEVQYAYELLKGGLQVKFLVIMRADSIYAIFMAENVCSNICSRNMDIKNMILYAFDT